MKLETIAVHGGYSPDPTTRAVAVPIYQTVAYAFDDEISGAEREVVRRRAVCDRRELARLTRLVALLDSAHAPPPPNDSVSK